MTLYSIRLLDEEKVIAWIKKWNQEQEERIAVRRLVLPVLQKWAGKSPNIRMKAEIEAALTAPGKTECPYIVSGPKDYDWQRWAIYGRGSWGEDPTSFIKSGSRETIDLGRLKHHNLTPIQKEVIEEAKANIERLEKNRDQIKMLLESKARPIQMAVQNWNETIKRAKTIETRMDAYGLSYLFSGDWNREYDIYE